MIDRIKFPGSGLQGGAPGERGHFSVDQVPKPAKMLISLAPSATVQLDLPGGGGYGDPLERSPEQVLQDVIDVYVSIEAARNLYCVAITYSGSEDQLVRLPEHFRVDGPTTEVLRSQPKT